MAAHFALFVSAILSISACNGHSITSNVYLEDLPGYAALQGYPASSVSTFYYKAINVKVLIFNIALKLAQNLLFGLVQVQIESISAIFCAGTFC